MERNRLEVRISFGIGLGEVYISEFRLGVTGRGADFGKWCLDMTEKTALGGHRYILVGLRLANWIIHSLPRPLLPPVTRMTFPSRSGMSFPNTSTEVNVVLFGTQDVKK